MRYHLKSSSNCSSTKKNCRFASLQPDDVVQIAHLLCCNAAKCGFLLQYVLHFPKGERYVSILKKAAEPEAQAQLVSERTRLKTLIRHQRAETAMLAEADEGLGQASPMVRSSHSPQPG